MQQFILICVTQDLLSMLIEVSLLQSMGWINLFQSCQIEATKTIIVWAYQTLIIESQMKYQREAWIGYDHRFCQRAATNLYISWSAIDTTLWNLVFAWKAKQPIAAISLIHKIKPMTTTKCPIVSQFAK